MDFEKIFLDYLRHGETYVERTMHMHHWTPIFESLGFDKLSFAELEQALAVCPKYSFTADIVKKLNIKVVPGEPNWSISPISNGMSEYRSRIEKLMLKERLKITHPPVDELLKRYKTKREYIPEFYIFEYEQSRKENDPDIISPRERLIAAMRLASTCIGF